MWQTGMEGEVGLITEVFLSFRKCILDRGETKVDTALGGEIAWKGWKEKKSMNESRRGL